MTAKKGRQYILTLALVSGLILVAGTFLKPKKRLAEADSLLSQTERMRLERLSQRRSLENVAAFFGQLAADLAPHVVRLERIGRSGILWDASLIVTAAGPQRHFPSWETVGGLAGTSVEAETAVACPDLPVAMLHLQTDVGMPPARRVPAELRQSGEWILAIWRRDDGRSSFAPGHFLGTHALTCGKLPLREVVSSLPLAEAMAGGGLFDLDGRLLALIVRCGERYVALAVDSVEVVLRQGDSFAGRTATRYGMHLQTLDKTERAYFKVGGGVLVTDLWRGYLADQAGLSPGDVIVELDGKPVRSLEDLGILVLPVAREMLELGVVRWGRKRQISLPARAPVLGGPEPNVVLEPESDPSGYRIDSVAAGGRLARAGIQTGDRILRVDQKEPRNAAEVRRALSSQAEQPTFVVFERNGHLWGVLFG